jgi:putative alpha-1,2-mannosidase
LGKITNLEIGGYIDDVTIEDKKTIDDKSLVNLVDTRRGTNTYNGWNQDGKQFSRGLCAPFVSVPNGFNFYTPFTTHGDYN